jgi:hypothetical protein
MCLARSVSGDDYQTNGDALRAHPSTLRWMFALRVFANLQIIIAKSFFERHLK